MADVPDLDTTKVGIASYFNALDNGAESVDPDEVLSASNIDSYTVYDNGVTGTLTHSFANKTRQFDFRVKSDGWFVVYIDRTNDTTAKDGYWDIIDDWTDQSAQSSGLPQTTLSVEIQNLVSQLSNSGNISFAHGSCGLFCYEYDGAGHIDLVSEQSTTGVDGGMAYRSGVSRKYHFAVAAIHDGSSDTETASVTFNGSAITSVDGGYSNGVLDVLANNVAPNSQTFYDNAGNAVNGESIDHLVIY